MASYKEFKEKYFGKNVDVDGFPANQPYQCWDVVAGKYFPYIGGEVIHCRQSGYVKDIANQRETNGILDFCVDVGLKETLQPGDICIWGVCKACPYSHIAIYDHDDGQEAVYFLGQNQPVPYVNIVKIPVKGIIGVFRPKIFLKKDEPIKPAETVKPKPAKADQILTKGSICRSEGFYVEDIRRIGKQWQIYNSWVGGWIPAAHVHEVDRRDGRMDNILHRNSGVAFDGLLTVIKVDVPNDMVYIKELKYWVKSRCLYEVKDGK